MIDAEELLTEFVSQMSDLAGAGDLRLNEKGVCTLLYDGRLKVSIEASSESGLIYFYSPVTTLRAGDDGQRKEVFEKCMELNCPGSVTRGCTLCWERRREEVLLHFSYPASKMDFTDFGNFLGAFVETTETIAASFDAESTPAEKTEDAASFESHFLDRA